MTAPLFRPSTLFAKKISFFLLLSGLSLLPLAGCGVGTVTHSSTGTFAIQGTVHGGQQPVGGSTIELYAAGKGGNGSPALKMIAKQVSTMTDGTFDITGDYTCANADDQVYLVATGGNPGLKPAVDNAALVMMAAFGSCENLPSADNIEINEVTTVAAVWALAPFIKSATEIGANSTNAKGIASAFRNAHLLADSSTGLAATLPSNLSVETGKLYALADALAPCVNSDGTTGCTSLFTAATPSGGSAPSNTLSASLSIVGHPGQNVALVYGAINAQAPFPSSLTKAPHDWTMSLTVTGGGLSSPGALGIDGFNNVWVASYPGIVSAFSAQGTPFNSTGYGGGILSEVYGLAVDFNNNIWVTNEEYPGHSPATTVGSVTAFHGAEAGGTAGSVLYGNYIYDNSVDFPEAVAADPDGDILILDYANSSVTEYTNGGVFLKGGIGAGNASLPLAISPDLNHGLWLTNTGNSVTHLDQNGTLLARVNCCDGANGVATDSLGNAWISNFYGGSISELAGNGAVEANTSGGGLSNATSSPAVSNGPSGIALDAAQNVWVANYYGANFSEVAGSASTLAAGTAISPSTGYGLDAHLLQPFTIAPDAGGNLWISNFGRSTVTMFFGLATPTKTPLLPSPTAP